jgi:hypothetical protein
VSTLADIFGKHGAEYLTQYGKEMLPSHRQTMRDIMLCRTQHLGGHTWWCSHCGEYHYSYHSCKNRHCPQCQNEKAEEWLEKQREKLLPVEYFLATFTLPDSLRRLVRSHQKKLYHHFFQASSLTLAKDPRFLGGQIGMIGVLQTWSRQLEYHPHIHYIIPGLGIDQDKQKIRFSKEEFLMYVKSLSVMFRRLFKEALIKAGFYEKLSAQACQQAWVVHVQSVGKAEAAPNRLAKQKQP